MADCDEVFNYWEVVSFLLYGEGLQTWEYAHEYALRTYAYIVPLKWLMDLFEPVLAVLLSGSRRLMMASNDNVLTRMETFHWLRSIVVISSACGELYWLLLSPSSSCRQTTTGRKESGSGRKEVKEDMVDETEISLITTALSCVMLPSALLPSATWMTLWCIAAALFATGRHIEFVVTCVIGTLCTGWPFGAVCVIPMAVQVLIREYYQQRRTRWSFLHFIYRSFVVAVAIQSIVMMIDRYYYGTWVAATWNIFIYNAKNSNDTLYGVEPISFYLKNLLLNLNYTGILGFVALPIYLLTGGRCSTKISMLLCLWPWIAITFPRPHKEERFLYPIYPVLIYGAVIAVDRLFVCCCHLIPFGNRDTKHMGLPTQSFRCCRLAFLAIFFFPSFIISICRVAALSRYYSAPLKLYAQVPPNSTVCTCGEWYRFPGSFYAQIGFLPSSFRGQLPQPFSRYGSRQESQTVLQPFNDLNQHEPARYVENIDLCDYIVDLENGDCPRTGSILVVASEPFLDASRTSMFHRTVYIPFVHETAMERSPPTVHYLEYQLLSTRQLAQDKIRLARHVH